MTDTPLHPAKTSMPSTCTTDTHTRMEDLSEQIMSKLGKEKIPDFFNRIMMPVNHALLLCLCKQSLATLSKRYSLPENTVAVANLNAMVNDRNQSHTVHLALLFLLLNVDQELKQRIMFSENTHMHAKLTRFFLDLKNEAVAPFFCNENMTATQLVVKSQELWQIA